jgi:ribosomal protein L31E
MTAAVEFFEKLKKYDGEEYLTRLISYNASPVIKKLKPAVLMNIGLKVSVSEEVWLKTQRKIKRMARVRVRMLCDDAKKRMVLAYDRGLLSNALCMEQASEMLQRLEYPENGIEGIIDRLCERCGTQPCPHEIGLFLGYPPDDVEAFIHNKGANYVLCGAWKAYGDVGAARRKWKKWRAAQEKMARLLISGVPCRAAAKLMQKKSRRLLSCQR